MRRLYVLFLCTAVLGGIANAQIGSSAPWSASPSNGAQTLGKNKTPPGGPSGSPATAPIDGGLSVLLAAGILYGGRAYRNHKKASAAVL